jgi:class 3 adenylate cyclase
MSPAAPLQWRRLPSTHPEPAGPAAVWRCGLGQGAAAAAPARWGHCRWQGVGDRVDAAGGGKGPAGGHQRGPAAGVRRGGPRAGQACARAGGRGAGTSGSSGRDGVKSGFIFPILQRQRVSYRALKRQFQLDDNCLEDVKVELIRVQQLAVDQAGEMLVWIGDAGSQAPPPATSNQIPERIPLTYTPPYLAEKILTSRSALEGERKQVTVLFADIVGSLGIIADRDPEEAQRLLDPVLDTMLEAVHHYEGMVNRVMGDGIMALFGAPLAHEDHAVRACYSALRMQQTIARYAEEVRRTHGIPITIRVGLNSGEIVVSSINNDLYMDYTVVGQTAHLASRMEQMAMPGSVLATADTARLVEGYVKAKSLGAMPIKGLAYPVEVIEITDGGSERTRFQASAWRGLTPFVGRTVELRQLGQALDESRGGHGQVLAVVGEPGMGKSRLIHEFVHSSQTEGCLILETNSASYGHAASYLPVIELLRHYYFKINLRDNAKSIREKVTGKILTLDPSLQDAIPPVLDLLDALDAGHPFQSLDPLQHRQHTFNAITRLLLSENRIQPVVAVFEDLHWNDSLTLGLLNEIVVNAQDARLLLLVTYRPEFQDEWKGRPNYRKLRLEPLESESLTALLQSLLGSDPALAEVKGFVHDRAGGNPFFVEELVRTLVDRGVLDGTRKNFKIKKHFSGNEIPPTVQAVLAARIDALPKTEKRLLQEASVIGYDIPLSLLHEISSVDD